MITSGGFTDSILVIADWLDFTVKMADAGGPMAMKNHDSTRGVARRLGRRTMLQTSAAAGLTVASGLFGGLLTPGQAAGADGSITPQNGKLRRVVSGLNPEGKSYIAIDDSAEVANIFGTPAGRALGEVAKNEPAQLPMNASGQT